MIFTFDTYCLESGEQMQFLFEDGEEGLQEAVGMIVAGGGRLISVTPVRETLEDVFLREVGGDRS